MRYPDYGQPIPKEKRELYNDKVLAAVRQGGAGLAPADAFNAYTGRGGLSGLDRQDFENYHEYYEAKRAFEDGQFFTPGAISSFLRDVLDLPLGASVCDPACGHGAILNAFDGYALHGCDIDEQATLVARFLFPEAQITTTSLAFYDPGIMVDAVAANPPFGTKIAFAKGDTMRSETACLKQAAQFLKPGGLAGVVLPATAFSDRFLGRAQIAIVEARYSVLAQVMLPATAFAAAGVKHYDTKVVLLQRWSDRFDDAEKQSFEDAPVLTVSDVSRLYLDAARLREDVMTPAVRRAHRARAKIEAEMAALRGDRRGFGDRVKKLLYDLKLNHPARVAEAQGLYERYIVQQTELKKGTFALEHLSPEERAKLLLTEEGVLSDIKAMLASQHDERKHRERIARGFYTDGVGAYRFVKSGHRLRYKAYTDQAEAWLTRHALAELSFTVPELAISDDPLPSTVEKSEYANLVRRKQARRQRYAVDLETVTPNPDLVAWIRRNRVVSPKDGSDMYATEMQGQDLARIYDRDFCYLDWQQGTGKTLAGFDWGFTRMLMRDARALVIVAPPLAIDQTWKPFLDAQPHANYTFVGKASDLPDRLNSAEKDDQAGFPIYLVPFSRVSKLARALRKFISACHRQVAVVVDEADEIANYDSDQTQGTLAAFRRARYKLLMTGTATRNHLGEYYPQLELLYNNSELMASEARHWYVPHDEFEDELVPKPNPYQGKPFPARKGRGAFTATFCPRRPTVFGILKHDQDVYNADHFAALVAKTRITRSFAEMAGPGRFSLHNHTVAFSSEEAKLHRDLVEELHRFLEEDAHFKSTGDSRKDAGLRAVTQLRLLIDSCSHPELFPEFKARTMIPFMPSRKMDRALEIIDEFPDEIVAVGIRRREAFGVDMLDYWRGYVERECKREVFVVDGDVTFRNRGRVLEAFQASGNGVLISTQQSLASSVNVPACNRVIIPALGWNVPRIMQYAFRFIRYDMEHPTEVHFVTYDRSIEANLWALLLNKERLNAFIKSGRVPATDEMVASLGLDTTVLDQLMTKTRDDDGNLVMNWTQKVDHHVVG